ncbi:GGDEF domain-containing protein [Pelomonas sp. SE-A7]|uniref:GGDEF domain-containing protein n=1 Tax=Pelomonas sp. SE-A7 TaxID=3054953 RepID=UPI00259C701A|nr:GGDEF domain-containing protein [Pelomonas sp. SE-A7]MDM4765147.1 GGDEF domain-containing protein [Pelomonas sp. SE-A7]
MKQWRSDKIEVRLVLTVGLGLLLFALVAGLFSYAYFHRHQLDEAESLQRQLVQTVRAQAEVAAFASNQEIARGVLEGLLANPAILAVRIEAGEGFRAELGSRQQVDFSAGREFALFSPVDHLERIGTLRVVQDDAHVRGVVIRAALFQTLLMLAQMGVAALIMALVLRALLVKPLVQLADSMKQMAPGSPARLDVTQTGATEEIRLLASSANTMLDAAQAALDEVQAQRGELVAKNEELLRLSSTDPLTGAFNRLKLDQVLEYELNRSQRYGSMFSLVLLDVDLFKSVNDCHGHAIGDRVLVETAGLLGAGIREVDIFGRWGGEEFLIICPDTPLEGAMALAEKLRALVAAHYFEVVGRKTCSFGVSAYRSGDNIPLILGRADGALYRSKAKGRNRVETLG